MDKVRIKKYRKAFKISLVREYEVGETIEGLRHRYGIGGTTTVQRWIKKYVVAGLRHEVVMII